MVFSGTLHVTVSNTRSSDPFVSDSDINESNYKFHTFYTRVLLLGTMEIGSAST